MKFWNSSIRNRLVIILIAFTIIPVIFTGLITGLITSRDARERVLDSLALTSDLKVYQVKGWAEDLQHSLDAEIERDRIGRLNQLVRLEPETNTFQDLHDQQIEIFDDVLASQGDFEELLVLDSEGNIVLSTNRGQEGRNIVNQSFFQEGLQGAYLGPVTFDPSLGYISVTVSQPILSSQGEAMGVLAGRTNLENLNKVMLITADLGETGEIYLTDVDGTLLTPVHSPDFAVGEAIIDSEGALSAAKGEVNGSGEYPNYQGVTVLGVYRWIPELQIVMLAEQHAAEISKTQRAATNVTLLSALIAVILGVIAALLIGRNLTQPLLDLTRTAENIAGGKLELRATTERQDEIGALAMAFNSMTAQLGNLIGNLDKRVAERTRQVQSRTDQLHAASEVGRSVTSILDSEKLIQNVVNVIQERFGLYYVGLFLLDDKREWAVLKAGTGEAGQVMLRRGHRLRIGESSMIGWSISNAQARIALEAKDDPVRLAAPDLPDTRSEAAIPLRSHGQVIGALTIQSTQPGAFDTDLIAIFQTMADQVAVALDNARLFSEAQQALEAAHAAYGELSHQAWIEKLRTRSIAFQRDPHGIAPVEPSSIRDGDSSLVIPIKARGQTIGYVNAQRHHVPENEYPEQSAADWNPQDINLLETLADQLAVALDSARLFEETQLQAQREHIVSEVTSRLRATLDIQNILQTATREMRDALDLTEVEVRIGTEPDDREGLSSQKNSQPEGS